MAASPCAIRRGMKGSCSYLLSEVDQLRQKLGTKSHIDRKIQTTLQMTDFWIVISTVGISSNWQNNLAVNRRLLSKRTAGDHSRY
jgi:hypothetical protein